MTRAAARPGIDWSQLWYPGPTRVFSAEELARAGGDRPGLTFLLLLAVNIVMFCFAMLVATPAHLVPRLVLLLLGFALLGVAGCVALWRRPARPRLNLLMFGAMGFFLLPLFGMSGGPVADRNTLLLCTGLATVALTLGFWFTALFRAHQIAARLRELAERERTQAALAQLLHAQIQPHFLFNSLASLQHWVESGDQRAAPLLRSLTSYLRATLPLFNRERLSLGEELEAVRHYLDVMRGRLGTRLTVAIDVPPALGGQLLPPALLLTLVENAIEHGVAPKLGAAHLSLRAGWEAGGTGTSMVWLEVADDGPGLPEPGGLPVAGRGVGLANARARLRQGFGPRASLLLQNRDEGGCVARVRLPALTSHHESSHEEPSA
ncbi:hypothetical protein G8A07_25770 [Roseateles sp. DAIF2]|uniref:sensor histidine kinase n=1 Tax=Roseateles sp. DAIF2 TaxID=2714952 RepID=UPI0018A30DEE|nr:histidine kinase [Roseateles sp. DAIF2]QPF75994.1 hypothetical protein G8A07_25770 [Roseateles sp. DAIF2]